MEFNQQTVHGCNGGNRSTVKPLLDWSNNILKWFESTQFYEYFNWYLSQPSNDSVGVVIVIVVLVICAVMVVALR
jgi:hypothetical protein